MADEIEDTTTVDEGAAEAPSVVQDAPAEPTGWDGWGDLAEDELVKRHSGDPIKMAQSYKALTQEFHQRGWEERNGVQQTAAPEVPEEPWQPLQDVQAPAGLDPVFYGKVAANYQVDPVGTFRELVQGGDEYAAYAEQVYEALEQSIGKFRTQQIYGQILREQAAAEMEDKLAERVSAEVTPLANAAALGKVDAGIELAKGVIGDEAWAKFVPYLSSLVGPEGLPEHIRQDPAKVRDTLVELQQWQIFREQQALNAAAASPTTTPIPARAGAQATLSGNTASRPEEQDYAERVKASLKTTKVRLTD